MCTRRHLYTLLYVQVHTHAHKPRKTGKVNTKEKKKYKLGKKEKKKGGEDPLQWKSQGPGVNCGNYVPIVRERVYVSAAKSL